MEEYILSCCSTADMPKEFFEERKISYVCFHYFMDGVEYPDDLGQSMSFQQFYKKMQDGADTKTSQINVGYFTCDIVIRNFRGFEFSTNSERDVGRRISGPKDLYY